MFTAALGIEVEPQLDAAGEAPVGWLGCAGGRTFWCGEVSFCEFRRQPAEVRAALRNDLGWFIAEVDREAPGPDYVILAKAASETAAFALFEMVLTACADPEGPPAAPHARSAPG